MLDLTTQTFAAVLRLAAPMDPPASVDVPAPIELPAPVAWLQDQDDHPLVSRTLLVLDPGEPDPRAVLAPLLWCFDAADHQRVAWLGDRLIVNGPVARSRPMPNVAMPIQIVDAVGGGPTRTGMDTTYFLPLPDGRRIVGWSFDRVEMVALAEEGDPRRTVLLDDATGLGRSQVESVILGADGGSLLVSVSQHRGPMRSGLWRLELPVAGAEPRPPGRIAEAIAGLIEALADGSVVSASRRDRGWYEAQRVTRSWPVGDRTPVVLADDLHWSRQLAVRPGSLAPGELDLAMVRFPGGELVLRRFRSGEGSAALPGGATASDGAAYTDRVLWRGPRAVEHLAFGPRGRFLVFSARDQERVSWVHALDLESGRTERLGAGRRPAIGPAIGPAPATDR